MPATKDEIAAKFMELAFRFGYRRTAVEDVARELRISKKTIYEHFSSKQDLLRYALELGAASSAPASSRCSRRRRRSAAYNRWWASRWPTRGASSSHSRTRRWWNRRN